jgi:hypothetical protein
MNALDEQIRDHIDALASPVTVEEVTSRGLVFRLEPPRRRLSLMPVAAASIVVVGVIGVAAMRIADTSTTSTRPAGLASETALPGTSPGESASNITDAPADEGVDSPAVTSPPSDSYATAMVDCMARKGFSVERNGNDGIKAVFPPNQFIEGLRAQDECIDETGFSDENLVPGENAAAMEAALASRHAALIAQRDCLVRSGFPVSEALSLDDFIAGGAAWTPIVPDTSAAELETQRALCPDPS